jgi:hypothetical protein
MMKKMDVSLDMRPDCQAKTLVVINKKGSDSGSGKRSREGI